MITTLATKGLLSAAENEHIDQMETEDLPYVEDATRNKSGVVGEKIRLGTRQHSIRSVDDAASKSPSENFTPEEHGTIQDGTLLQHREANLILAKIAFSSGLARSVKLAVLESALERYFESTRSIPGLLSQGSKLPFTRDFILRKTGELLTVRAQLNLYSELTDSIPDLFWDSRHELGLGGHFERIGRALDVNIRIKTLNQKMDYAQDIAAVLRERLSEKHGLLLEWLIIFLIAIEVAFGTWHIWKERVESHDPHSIQSLTRQYLEQALAEDSDKSARRLPRGNS